MISPRTRIATPVAILAMTLGLAGAAALAPSLPALASPPASQATMPHSSLRHIEGRLAALKVELAITGAQTPAWQAYAAAVKSDAPALEHQRHQLRQARMKHASAPQWLALRQQMLAAESTHLAKVAAAFTPLYDALDPGQKKIADHLLGPHSRHRWHHHG